MAALAEPDYSFVTTAMTQRPYAATLERLRDVDSLEIREHTDITNYVAFAYKRVGSSQTWVLELSMAGPFAVLARTGGGRWLRLLNPDDTDLPPIERQILDILAEFQFEYPTRETLERPLEMTLDYTDPENVRVYHALFSDEDFLPWQFSPLYREHEPEP